MERRSLLQGLGAAALAPLAKAEAEAEKPGPDTVYELRIYHANDGKLPLLLERFHKEGKLFARAGMPGVAYWVPTEEPLAGRTLFYMLRHRSRESATESWAKFRADPEWIAIKAESEKDGALVSKSESTFLKLTDFSPAL